MLIQFGKNVVEKKNRSFVCALLNYFDFCEFRRKRGCALLSLRAEMPCGNSVYGKFDVVGVYAVGGRASRNIFFVRFF